MSTLSARPFKFVERQPERSYLAFSAILQCRSVPVGVVYAGSIVSLWTRTGEPMVRSRSNFDDDGAVLVPYLQVVFPVSIIMEGKMSCRTF